MKIRAAILLDTGVRADHAEFEPSGGSSRVVQSWNFSTELPQGVTVAADTTNGCAGTGRWHGTAVASILAGTNVGAAKTQVISLRYVACETGHTETDRLINAINWINSDANAYRQHPGVINHSGFIPPWFPNGQALRDTVLAVVDGTPVVEGTKFPYFTSADNFSTDAQHFSPNQLGYTKFRTGGKVLVVGGTSVYGTADHRYQLWVDPYTMKIGQDSGSNAGSYVGIYAPAVSIYAARNASATAYSRFQNDCETDSNGTSFASPLAAALGARYIEKTVAQGGPRPQHAQVYAFLVNNATTKPINVTTPAYYFCSQRQRSHWQDFTPPTDGVCPDGTEGVNGTSTPYYFPAVGNDSDAGMLFWDEGVCW